jgi:hypothetical protein
VVGGGGGGGRDRKRLGRTKRVAACGNGVIVVEGVVLAIPLLGLGGKVFPPLSPILLPSNQSTDRCFVVIVMLLMLLMLLWLWLLLFLPVVVGRSRRPVPLERPNSVGV